jgi:nitroreductase
VVQERNRIDALKEFCIKKSIERFTAERKLSKTDLETRIERITQYYDNYLSAPVYVVILTDNNSEYPDYNHWDGPLAAANLMLAARALGYGTVFCTDSINEEITKEFFNIPDQYTRVCITPIGVPDEWPESPEKKALENLIVHDTF